MPDRFVATSLAVLATSSAAWLVVRPWAEVRAGAVGSAVGRGRPTMLDRLRRRGVRIVGRVGLGPASRRRRARERVRVIQALGALAAELEAGQSPGAALRRAGGEPSVWPVAHAAADMDGGVVDALAVDARLHGVLRQLAACWQVGADTGAGLAVSVGRLAAAARAAEDVRVDLEGQLAGPRATARMLAVLPLVGIGFGMMLGSDPLAWLVGTMPGRACLLAGTLLTALGMWWTGRIAARVERLL
jgi:tight adherence protein B